ncbi:DUF624 domain-containing protein [Brachybacterium sp. YJGR34]|uniref:DUF624 domain-containing protein n=1 Tax=Brachybacterium sp. YJGR34 TaxID=2059911 RepID=UPI000E0A5CE2|nr:DUF624 domain-containing protein [Brachybacterium sp. YJGR34]
MLFSFESFATLNHWLGAFWRLIWLNLLWTAVTVLGLVVVGIGPASYALARCLDGWLRRGEPAPTARSFFRHAREQGFRPVVMGWLLLGAGTVIGVNLVSLSDWYLRAANLVALAALLLITAYVFFVMAATEVVGIRRQVVTALLLGLGSLHWSVLGGTAVALVYLAMFRFAMPLLFLLGAVLPALLVALILRSAWRGVADPATAAGRSADGGASAGLSHAVRADALPPG